MVKYSASLNRTFSALADPIRRGIVKRLAAGEMQVSELGKPYKVSAPAISRHLRVLKKAGLVLQERQGRIRICRLRPEPLRNATEWLNHYQKFWTDRLDDLAAYLEKK